MTNNLTNDETSSPAVADAEMERLLSDAYDSPPVPRSLLRRIDRAVEAEWGQSPELVASRTRRLSQALSRGARWAKAVPLAATLATFAVLAVLFTGDSRAFGWASMLDAMAKQGVVRAEGPQGIRWLALSEGLIGERTADSARMLHLGQSVLLERRRSEDVVRRREFRTAGSANGRDRLVLGFLLSDSVSHDQWQRFAGTHVVDESWKSVTAAGGKEQIVLQVEFRTAAAERFQLEVTLDPDSQLPTACKVDGDGRQPASLAFSYPSLDVDEFRQRNFPVELRVVDLTDDGGSGVKLAAKDQPATGTVNTSAEARPESDVASANPDRNRTSGGATDGAPADGTESTSKPPSRQQTEPPMSGAPSTWRPVEVANRSDRRILQEMDSLLAALWDKNNVEPAGPADDEELLRRVYLDLAGRTPTVHEVRQYLNDNPTDRYQRLVDRLLASPDHASHLATAWRKFLIPDGVDLTAFGGVEVFDRWLADRFSGGDPYDEIVRSLLLAEGRLSRSGPLLFYSAVRLEPERLASRTARVFLGMRLECAQCHDHPFEPWTQREFWSFAAFFARISRPQAELESVSTVMRVSDVDRGDVMLPETETVVAPQFLDGTKIADHDKAPARREQLAYWLTGPQNPYFARATVNRVWGHMFGKGIVDPIDDFGVLNSPKSPELLDLLAGHLINTGFDLRELFRAVALSRAYRLSSGAESVDEKRLELFGQMHVKTLTAEQVYDCITVATMLDSQQPGDPNGFNVVRFGNIERERFLQQFRTPGGRRTEYLAGIPQALTLMNGTLIEGATGLSSSGLLKSLEAPFFTNRQRIEVLYMATLSRRPRESEWQLLNGYVPEGASGTELQETLADILWALLNSAEFTMNH